MFAVIPLLQLAGLLGSSWYLNAETFKSEDLKPQLGGMDAANVFAGVGAIAALFFGGPIGALGVGALGAGLVNMNTRRHVEAAAEKWVQESLSMSTPGGYFGPPADRGGRGKRMKFVPKFVENLLAA